MMQTWNWEGNLYISANPGTGRTWMLVTHGFDSPEHWCWFELDSRTAREVWFAYSCKFAESVTFKEKSACK